MQSVSSFEGIGSPLGTLQVMAPFPEAHLRNSSHIQEVYQNLPQLQKAMYLPITYKSYETQNTIPAAYLDQHQTNFHTYAKQNHKLQYAKQRPEQVLEKDQILYKRNGQSSGWGDAGHHHHHSHGNSSALSALALLGFMFFLQLIQNSLQNNRQMLAAASLTATPGVATGRGNAHLPGHNRQKRNIHEDKGAPGHAAAYDRVKYNKMFTENPVNNTFTSELHSEKNNFSSSSTHKNKKLERGPPVTLKLKNNPMDILRSSSVHCCQLIACKIGESIYDHLDTTTGFMFRMLGATMIPRIPKKTWTGRLLRAFDKGWKKESCDSLYRNCGILYNMFYKATNTIHGRKGTKHPNSRYQKVDTS